MRKITAIATRSDRDIPAEIVDSQGSVVHDEQAVFDV